mgnify:CR=1 FL=1
MEKEKSKDEKAIEQDFDQMELSSLLLDLNTYDEPSEIPVNVEGRSGKEPNQSGRQKPQHAKKQSLLLKIIFIVTIILFMIVAGVFAGRHYQEQNRLEEEHRQEIQRILEVDTFYEGIFVSGVDLSNKTKEEAKSLLVEIEPSIREDVMITASCSDVSIELTEDDFVFSFNTDEILEKAYQTAREGDLEKRYEQVIALKEAPVSYTITATLDKTQLDEAIKKVSQGVYVPAKNASLKNFDPFNDPKFVFQEGNVGRELNESTFREQLLSVLEQTEKKGEINVATNEIPFERTIADLQANMALLARFSTESTNNANANHNMSIAMDAANGTMLEPGEIFSFNASTGDSNSPSLGYLPAGAISGGKIIQSYGGGICQSATTIYGAAIRANMTIVERYNHLWKSSYVPIGVDATIDYPGLELKFRNDLSDPVYIGAYMSGTTLVCEIYGPKPQSYDDIEVESWVTETIPAPEAKKTIDASLSAGQQVVETDSHTGYRVEARRIFYKNGNEVKRESLPSSYYPETAGVIRVGPDS